MAAPVYAWSNFESSAFATGTSVNVGGSGTHPNGSDGAYTAGTILIASVVNQNGAAITGPAGWTLIGSQFTDSSGYRNSFWWHLCNGSESGSFTFSWTGSTGFGWTLAAYTGAAASPIDASSTTTWSSASSVTVPVPNPSGTITPSSANDTIVLLATFGGGSGYVVPANMTSRFNATAINATPFGAFLADIAPGSAAAFSDTFTAVATFRGGGYALIALAPAAAAATTGVASADGISTAQATSTTVITLMGQGWI